VAIFLGIFRVKTRGKSVPIDCDLKNSAVLTNSGANFLYIFSAENFVEFVGKTIFLYFFRGKFQFFPTFFGGKFSAEFSPEKMCEKSAPAG
jgi:hypothetical protein